MSTTFEAHVHFAKLLHISPIASTPDVHKQAVGDEEAAVRDAQEALAAHEREQAGLSKARHEVWIHRAALLTRGLRTGSASAQPLFASNMLHAMCQMC